MTGRPRKPEIALIVRNAMLDAATSVFARKGYAAATMNEIAAASGYTAPAFYKYFKGKQELFEALVERVNGEANQLLSSVTLPDDASFAERVEELFRATFAFIERRAESFSVMTNITASTEALASVRFRKRQLDESLRAQEQLVAWFAAAGVEELGNITARDAAALYRALNQGIYLQWAHGSTWDEKTAGKLSDLLPLTVNFFLHGISATPPEPKPQRPRPSRKKPR